MKEKSYFEVLAEVEGRSYDNLETQLEIGENCVRDIKALESNKDAKTVKHLVTVNGKQYNISISEWKGSQWNT